MQGLRIDKALALLEQIGTRSRASYLLENSLVFLNSKIVKASASVKIGDTIEIHLPAAKPVGLQPYNFPLDILFEDQDVIVINKPSGLVMHPAAGHEQDTLVNALLAHTKNLSMKFGEERPGIVHRIDKETSGIVVVAKNDKAHEALTSQFKERSTHRIYYALCLGTSPTLSGTIKSYLARHPVDRKKYASILGNNKKPLTEFDENPEFGKWAITHFECLKRHKNFSYMKLKLETGRTHQIRIHLSEQGLPIVGDNLYGADKKIKIISANETVADIKNLKRFLLHAAELGFTHPTTKERMFFTAPWPKDDEELLKKWGIL